ncbi:MAG: class I SAM-dependent methyltransferase [Bacillota bacterium]
MNPKTKWNRKYLERITIKEEEPKANARLKNVSASLKGGNALDLACGLGGNSLFLAQLNYEVLALDVSDVAVDFIRERAINQQLSIKSIVCDLTDITNLSLEKNSFDLVVITYYLDRAIFPFVKKIVSDHGYFFMETFYHSPKVGNNGVSNQYKLEPQELLGEFGNWKVLFYEEDEEEGRQTILCQKQVTD